MYPNEVAHDVILPIKLGVCDDRPRWSVEGWTGSEEWTLALPELGELEASLVVIDEQRQEPSNDDDDELP